MIDVVGEVKRRVMNAADGVVKELSRSHGINNVSVVVKETAKSITITVRESAVVEDAEDLPSEQGVGYDPINYLDK